MNYMLEIPFVGVKRQAISHVFLTCYAIRLSYFKSFNHFFFTYKYCSMISNIFLNSTFSVQIITLNVTQIYVKYKCSLHYLTSNMVCLLLFSCVKWSKGKNIYLYKASGLD